MQSKVIEESQYLTFLSGSEVFGIGILKIKEIKEYSSVTTIPMMPEYVKGVIN
ncbi:MAG TPA: chemotaxis protein CheW, partial [Leptospiraceae bacterium]|nr:chemotaxis protein CheW [Leptospiraceae bacterium]